MKKEQSFSELLHSSPNFARTMTRAYRLRYLALLVVSDRQVANSQSVSRSGTMIVNLVSQYKSYAKKKASS